MLKLEDAGLAALRFAGARKRRRYDVRLATAEPVALRRAPPEHGDERTARQIGEAERGGISSAEGAARWESGENPGGLHHKAQRAPEEEPFRMPERERPEQEEPQARKERAPGGERHMPATRRGG